MITSRNLYVDEGRQDAAIIPVQTSRHLPQPMLTVRRKISAPLGDLHATVTIEAVDEVSSQIVRTESFKTVQPILQSMIIPRIHDFIQELTADGYKIKN